jgi:hypothetical protein
MYRSIPSTKGMLLLFLVILGSARMQAQDQKAGSWLHVGFEIPAYAGDLNKYAQFNGAFALNHKERLNGQFTFLIGTVKGENRRLDIPPSAIAPNRFFSTSLIEFSYQVNYHLIKTPNFGLYIGQGIGLLRFDPKDENDESLSGQADTRAEGESYRNITLMLPTKVGVQYVFDNHFGVGFEAGWHNPLTDYLDNISDLGTGGSDNILGFRISLLIPLSYDEL